MMSNTSCRFLPSRATVCVPSPARVCILNRMTKPESSPHARWRSAKASQDRLDRWYRSDTEIRRSLPAPVSNGSASQRCSTPSRSSGSKVASGWCGCARWRGRTRCMSKAPKGRWLPLRDATAVPNACCRRRGIVDFDKPSVPDSRNAWTGLPSRISRSAGSALVRLGTITFVPMLATSILEVEYSCRYTMNAADVCTCALSTMAGPASGRRTITSTWRGPSVLSPTPWRARTAMTARRATLAAFASRRSAEAWAIARDRGGHNGDGRPRSARISGASFAVMSNAKGDAREDIYRRRPLIIDRAGAHLSTSGAGPTFAPAAAHQEP
jgi:hypothetical protein